MFIFAPLSQLADYLLVGLIMKTSFTPEYPYNDYTHANIVHDKNMNRKIVCLYHNKSSKRKSISYAKYLYAVHLWKTKKQLIPDGMTVDHINDDKTDDRIENLQLLSNSDNIRKQNDLVGRKLGMLICPVCMKVFTVNYNNTNFVPSKFGQLISCCRNHSDILRGWALPDETRIEWSYAQRVAVIRAYNTGNVILEEIHNPIICSYLI